MKICKSDYKSWLAVQKLLQQKLEGQMRWLAMLKSDAELVEISGQTLQGIRSKANEMLSDSITVSGFDSTPQRTKSKKSQKLSSSKLTCITGVMAD
ncbi:hypothetical protein H1Q63_26635 [Desmonostoc muscorum CCALA 125]|nr:hypothetical protein [Desmonostoc muscorum CCALA 125]